MPDGMKAPEYGCDPEDREVMWSDVSTVRPAWIIALVTIDSELREILAWAGW